MNHIVITEGPHKGIEVPDWLMSKAKSGDKVSYVTTGQSSVGKWYLNDVEVTADQPCACATNCLSAEGIPVSGYCRAERRLQDQPAGDE